MILIILKRILCYANLYIKKCIDCILDMNPQDFTCIISFDAFLIFLKFIHLRLETGNRFY